MYFDRFDICEAYYVYMMLWHSGGYTRRDDKTTYNRYQRNIQYQLRKIQFKPSPMIKDENDLTENGQEIYNNLVSTYEKG